MARVKKKPKVKKEDDGGEGVVVIINSVIIGVLLLAVFIAGVIFGIISLMRGNWPELLLAVGFLLSNGAYAWAFYIAWNDEPSEIVHVMGGFLCAPYWLVFCLMHFDRYLLPLLASIVGFMVTIVGTVTYHMRDFPRHDDFVLNRFDDDDDDDLRPKFRPKKGGNPKVVPKQKQNPVPVPNAVDPEPKAGLAQGRKPINAMTAHWPFELFDAGFNIHDLSGRNNSGKFFNPKGIKGIKGVALLFDNDRNQYFDFGASPDFDYEAGWEFTYAGWFQSSSQAGTILCQCGDTPGRIQIAIDGTRLTAQVRDDVSAEAQRALLDSKTKVDDGRWRHFALVRASDSCHLYLDGQAVDVAPKKGLGPITTRDRAIGSDRSIAKTGFAAGAVFQGAVDEFRIYQKALSAKEIQALKNNP